MNPGSKKIHKYYQPTLQQVFARKFGGDQFTKAHKTHGSDTAGFKKNLYDRWRMEPRKHKYGGSGYDEVARTALARESLAKIRAARSNIGDAKAFAQTLSQDRVNTDALVWFHKGEQGGHPGALRDNPNGTNVVHGHGGRDSNRAKAVTHEMQQALPNPSTASTSQVIGAAHLMTTRGQLETIRTMSLPFEEFMATGPKATPVFHARYGDVSQAQPGNFQKMAAYVHNERERLKWDTARKLIGQGMPEHVPQEMQQYIAKHNGDHTQAQVDYWQQVQAKTETRVNTATSSQAGPLLPTETMRGTAAQVATGRPRALSNARAYQKPI